MLELMPEIQVVLLELKKSLLCFEKPAASSALSRFAQDIPRYIVFSGLIRYVSGMGDCQILLVYGVFFFLSSDIYLFVSKRHCCLCLVLF